MERKNEKLIIDGTAIYELDLECVRKKQKRQENNTGAAPEEEYCQKCRRNDMNCKTEK